jgi:transcriptional regulator with XRE-family HTH domain
METLGTKLRSAREKQKLSLDKVSELTKIRVHIIKALEDGNYSVVPAVYAKSFVITYAKLLKISISEIQDEIDEIFKSTILEPIVIVEPEKIITEKRPKKSKFSFQKDNKTKIVNLLIYLLITIAISMVIYFTFFESDSESNNDSNNENASDTTVIDKKKDGLFSFYDEPDSIKLEAKSLDSAWLKINIDGKISEQYYMAPGTEKSWSASEFFLITLGNAGAVEFKRNGELLPKLGPINTVVRNIKITVDEVINSSKPWTSDTVVINPVKPRNKKKLPKQEPQKIVQPTTIEKSENDILDRLREINQSKPSLKPGMRSPKPMNPVPVPEENKPPE